MRSACYVLVLTAFLSNVAFAKPSSTAELNDAGRVYRIIAAASLSDRHIIFRNLSPELKAALWRIHLTQFLDDPRLSPAQRQLVQTAIEILIPAAFEGDSSGENVSEALTRLEQSVRDLFPRDLATNVFAVLGPPPASDDPSALSGMIANHPLANAKRKVPTPLEVADCNCSRVSDWCWSFFGDSQCTGGPCYLADGCGFGWKYKCTSLCEIPNQ
jgi:hypothetical protein